MATNSFNKDEINLFSDVLMKFEDKMTISKNCAIHRVDSVTMERTNDIVRRPMPYIMNSQSRVIGTPITAQGNTQRRVPSQFSEQLCVPFTLDAKELRDSSQYPQMAESASQRLASDIENSIKTVVSNEGSLFVPISGAAGNLGNIAEARAMMLQQGMSDYEKCLALDSTDYNGLADNLQVAARSFGNKKSDKAYEECYVGRVAGFETLEMDLGKTLTAAAGSCTIDTTGAQIEFTPNATQDNRRQTITVSATTNVKAGDAFTIAGIKAVHHISKDVTPKLKTFRVVSVDSGTTMTITPAITANATSTSTVKKQYKNVEAESTSATAAITFLNQNTAVLNPFWCKEAIEILPGRYSVPTGEGVAVMNESTESGVEVVMTKSFSQGTFESTIAFDVIYGVTMLNPEMAGVIQFGQ